MMRYIKVSSYKVKVVDVDSEFELLDKLRPTCPFLYRFTVEFSSLKAFAKFVVDFQLDSCSYPKTLEFTVTPKIGRVT
mgnify:CR=1 FL=1